MSARLYSSRSVRIGTRMLAATAVVAAPLLLQGCTNDGASAIYKDQDACVAAQVFTPQYCAENFEKAKAEHTRLAPRYEGQEDCEKDWGRDSCETSPDPNPDQTAQHHGGGGGAHYVYAGSGSSSYSPRMNGYWVGHVSEASTDGGAATRRSFSYPVYRTEGGNYSALTEQSLGEGGGRIYTRPNIGAANEVMVAPHESFGRGMSFASRPTSFGGFGAAGHGFAAGA